MNKSIKSSIIVKSTKDVSKMIHKIHNSKLNEFPTSRINHEGSLRVLYWVRDRTPNIKELKAKLDNLERTQKQEYKRLSMMKRLTNLNYLIREGKIGAIKWCLGLPT